jgi:hypothetical protein
MPPKEGVVRAKERQARGGVSAVPHKAATHGTATLAEPRGASPLAAAFPGFSFHGGPVVKLPQLYATFWGPEWLSDPAHLTRAGHLSQFLKDLGASKYMNVLSQYGSGSGAGSACFIRSSFLNNVSNPITDANIQSTIQSCINAGVLTEQKAPSNVVLVIFASESVGIGSIPGGGNMCEASGDVAFGYHSHFTTTAGNPFYYAVIPGLSDTCLTESCPTDVGCSLHLAEAQEQRLTQVTSHEFAEMITDPELNAWWDSNSGAELGDICNGESDTITVGPNTWTVQREYSKTDDINSNGATFCVTEEPNPLPKLSPGPASPTIGVARIQQLSALNHMLPLPDIHFDLSTKKVTMNESQLKEYLGRLSHPFHHSHLVPGLPSLLRQLADAAEKI